MLAPGFPKTWTMILSHTGCQFLAVSLQSKWDLQDDSLLIRDKTISRLVSGKPYRVVCGDILLCYICDHQQPRWLNKICYVMLFKKTVLSHMWLLYSRIDKFHIISNIESSSYVWFYIRIFICFRTFNTDSALICTCFDSRWLKASSNNLLTLTNSYVIEIIY